MTQCQFCQKDQPVVLRATWRGKADTEAVFAGIVKLKSFDNGLQKMCTQLKENSILLHFKSLAKRQNAVKSMEILHLAEAKNANVYQYELEEPAVTLHFADNYVEAVPACVEESREPEKRQAEDILDLYVGQRRRVDLRNGEYESIERRIKEDMARLRELRDAQIEEEAEIEAAAIKQALSPLIDKMVLSQKTKERNAEYNESLEQISNLFN